MSRASSCCRTTSSTTPPPPGVIIVLNKRKPAVQQGQDHLLNASQRFTKGQPKNFLSTDSVLELARIYQAGESVDGELAVVDVADIVAADYNLSPARWAALSNQAEHRTLSEIVEGLASLERRDADANRILEPLTRVSALQDSGVTVDLCKVPQKDTEFGPIPETWELCTIGELCDIWSGGTPRKSVPEFWVGDIPWVSGKDLKAPVIEDAIDHLSEGGLSSGSRLAPADSVLLLVRGMGSLRTCRLRRSAAQWRSTRTSRRWSSRTNTGHIRGVFFAPRSTRARNACSVGLCRRRTER